MAGFDSPQASRMCSTPLGITEVGTRDRRVATDHAARCAQRLSASLRLAHELLATMEGLEFVCSTPLGITEVGTLRP